MKGKKIYLRAIEPEDIELLYKWENDISIWHLSNTIAPFSKQTLKEYISNAHLDIYSTKQLRLMLNSTDPIQTVGCIDLFDFDPVNMRAGIGILIDKNYREKGYASEALSLLIDYAFKILRLHQLYCNITIDNQKSLKLFQKYKFSIIGLKKEWLRNKNKWDDEYMLQLINNIE